MNEKLGVLEEPRGWTPDAARAFADLPKRASRWPWALAAASTAAAGILIAFPTSMAFASRCVEACGQFIRSSSPVATAPDFTLNDAEGRPWRLSDLRGKVVLLNFWATWCNPCRVEVPWFIEFERSYRDRGVAVVGVSLDEDGWDSVTPFLARHGVNYRVLIGNDAVAGLFGGVQSLPATFIIGRDGRIQATHIGLASREVYEDEIRAAMMSR